MASPLAEFVISLADGHIISQGSVSDALKKNDKLAEEYKHDEEAMQLDEAEEVIDSFDSVGSAKPAVAPKDGKIVVAEEIAFGHVSWKVCELHCPRYTFTSPDTLRLVKLFLVGLGGRWPVLFWAQYLFGSSMSELFGILEMYWLGYWASQYTLHGQSDVNVGL